MSLESTTYPGTTEEVISSRINEMADMKIGDNIFIVYSPEREDPGRSDYTIETVPKICGGVTPACLRIGSTLYSQVIETVVEVSSTKVAEMTKILENIHRAVNIGLVNEMKIIADKMDINIYEVIKAAATKPFGFVPYYPGPGLGGHCIPIDPFYLTWKAKEYGVNTRFIELAGEVNGQMPQYVVNKSLFGLNELEKPMKNSNILILGAAYKKNVDDFRESPALKIMEILGGHGAKISYHDPHVPKIENSRSFDKTMSSIELSKEILQKMDQVIIVTDHTAIDYDFILENSAQIIDARGVYSDIINQKVIQA